MEENQIENEIENTEPTLVEKLAESEDKYVRLYAEFDNYKRRVQKDKEEIRFNTKVAMITPIIDMDNDVAIAIKNIKDESAREGVQLIAQKLESFLKSQGIETIQTDTYDIMGKIISEKMWEPVYNNVENIEYVQQYPMYSSIYVIQNGMRKPLWYYEKNNIKVENIPSKKVKLLSSEKISDDITISSTELFSIIKDRIDKVKKDTYRQDEIIALWSNKLEHNNKYTISKWKFTVTSGGYIRYLANKMAGCCYDIERVCYHDL